MNSHELSSGPARDTVIHDEHGIAERLAPYVPATPPRNKELIEREKIAHDTINSVHHTYVAMLPLETDPMTVGVEATTIARGSMKSVYYTLCKQLGIFPPRQKNLGTYDTEKVTIADARKNGGEVGFDALAAANFFRLLDRLITSPQADSASMLSVPLRQEGSMPRQRGRLKKHNVTKKEFLDSLPRFAAGLSLEELQEMSVDAYRELSLMNKVLMTVDALQALNYYREKPYLRTLKLGSYLRDKALGQMEKIIPDMLAGSHPVSAINRLYKEVYDKVDLIYARMPEGHEKQLLAKGVEYRRVQDAVYKEIDERMERWERYRSNETAEAAEPETAPVAKNDVPEKFPGLIAPVVSVEVSRPEEAQAADEEEAAIDPAVTALLETYEAQRKDYDQFMTRYRPSKKQLQKLGLAPVLWPLINGFEDTENGLVHLGDSEPRAKQALQTLSGLRFLAAANGGSLKLTVEAELKEEERLIGILSTTREQLETAGARAPYLRCQLLTDLLWMQQNHEMLAAAVGAFGAPETTATYQQVLKELFEVAAHPDFSVLQAAGVVLEQVPELLPETSVEQIEEEYPGGTDVESITEIIDVSNAAGKSVDEQLQQDVLSEETVAAIKQLDWEVFPAEASLNDIVEYTRKNFGAEVVARVEWGRIKDLMSVQAAFGGIVYRAKDKSLGAQEPYYVLEAEIEGKKFAIAENPVYGNATYVLREDRAEYGATWRQVFEQSRQLARLLGARQVVHGQTDHLQKILDKIAEELSK